MASKDRIVACAGVATEILQALRQNLLVTAKQAKDEIFALAECVRSTLEQFRENRTAGANWIAEVLGWDRRTVWMYEDISRLFGDRPDLRERFLLLDMQKLDYLANLPRNQLDGFLAKYDPVQLDRQTFIRAMQIWKGTALDEDTEPEPLPKGYRKFPRPDYISNFDKRQIDKIDIVLEADYAKAFLQSLINLSRIPSKEKQADKLLCEIIDFLNSQAGGETA